MVIITTLINSIVSLLTLLLIVNSILSYFLSPYHPVRRGINKVLEPLLSPIRKLIPPSFGFDFSPIILIILVQILGALIIALLRRIG